MLFKTENISLVSENTTSNLFPGKHSQRLMLRKVQSHAPNNSGKYERPSLKQPGFAAVKYAHIPRGKCQEGTPVPRDMADILRGT